MASIITATTTSGLTQSADNSGILQLASGTGNLVTVPSATGTMALTASPTFTGTATIPTATVTTLNTPSGVLATQNGMTGIAKAWVQFTNSSGTLTVNSSFNVSSLTYVSTGLITVNFTTAMPNSNYALVGSSNTTGVVAGVLLIKRSTATTSSTSVETVALNTSLTNMTENNIAVFSS